MRFFFGTPDLWSKTEELRGFGKKIEELESSRVKSFWNLGVLESNASGTWKFWDQSKSF